LSGDAKSLRSPPFNKGVTTVTGVTTSFEERAAGSLPSDCPSEWYAIREKLKLSEPASWASAERWSELLADAESFLVTLGKTADRLGWTTLNLFGVHPIAPTARFDVMGLIPLLGGRRVAALTERSASIQAVSGARLTYRRSDRAGAVLLTDVHQLTCPELPQGLDNHCLRPHDPREDMTVSDGTYEVFEDRFSRRIR
jgi:hypothetical protein